MIQGLGWSVQCLPVGDKKEHKTNFPEDCDCIVRVDDVNGTIIHNSFDGREQREEN